MSDLDWDADDFEPEAPTVKASAAWEGEDEDVVKGSWEDSDEEETDPDAPKAIQKPKKKSLKEKLAEKEAEKDKQRKNMEEAARKAKEAQTPEGQAAERLRLRAEQEKADLDMAKLTFGDDMKTTTGDGDIDRLVPSTKDEFDHYGTLLKDRITRVDQRSIHYVGFLENLFRDLVLGVEPDDIKKLTSGLNILANEKQKQQKPATKSKKKKNKASLQGGKDAGLLEDQDYHNDCDDFI